MDGIERRPELTRGRANSCRSAKVKTASRKTRLVWDLGVMKSVDRVEFDIFSSATNSANRIVNRNSSGNFSAGTIFADLNGSCSRVSKALSFATTLDAYDPDNINFLSHYGIEAEYKPFLYSEKLKRIENKPDDELDIDILFYGDHTCPYRLQTLREIFSPHVGVKEEGVVMLWNVSGKKLDDYISRAKVILDLHTSEENKVQKQTH